MLSRKEFDDRHHKVTQHASQLEATHDSHVALYKRTLRQKAHTYQHTLDAILDDIRQLEADPAHQCIAEVHSVGEDIGQQQALLEYVMACVRVEELLALVEVQSADLSTVGMALDALEQLLLIKGDLGVAMVALKGRVDGAIATITTQLTGDFTIWMRQVLERVKWPVVPTGEDLELLLLTCQSYRLFELICAGGDDHVDDTQSQCVGMLTESMAAQFHFHFSLDKPTNRVDKPEWALDYILSVIQGHYAFFCELDDLIPSGLPRLFIAALVGVVRERFAGQRDLIMDNMLLPVVVESVVSFSESLQSDDYQYPFACNELLSLFLQTQDQVDRWMDMERSRLLDGYEDAFASLPVGHLQYNNTDPITDYLQSHYAYLRSLSVPRFQSQLLTRVTLPVLERLLQKLEFDIPASLSRQSDVQQCAQQHAFCASLRNMWGVEWGEDLAMITLASTEECKAVFTFDPSARVGTVFAKAVDELVAIEGVCVSRLYVYVKDPGFALLLRWSSAMHYSKPNDGGLPDTLRQALIDIPTRLAHIKEPLQPLVFHSLFQRFLADLEDVIYGKLVLRNYFTIPGALSFHQHLGVIDGVLAKVHAVPTGTPSTSIRDGKLGDCVKLLTLPEEEGGSRSAMVLKRLLQNDKLAEATRVLSALGVCKLTLAECEQVLASRR